MHNLELKAPITNAEELVQKVVDIGAQFQWRKQQTDTYFNVATGKLKLREQEGSPAELIAYLRPEENGSRVSQYEIFETDEPDKLKRLLANTIGIRGIVSKQRTLYLWENVRIHFDEVEDLGQFIEFEAVMNQEADMSVSRDRIDFLSRTLSITTGATVAGGYLEMLIK